MILIVFRTQYYGQSGNATIFPILLSILFLFLIYCKPFQSTNSFTVTLMKELKFALTNKIVKGNPLLQQTPNFGFNAAFDQ